MRRRTFVRPEAQTDIKEAALWYEDREAGLGTSFVNQISNTLQQIADHPLSFPLVSEDNVRRALSQKFPYSIYFINQPDAVSVIAVLHQHRRSEAWQTRERSL
jgi:plasmid stabilization system protein ParE